MAMRLYSFIADYIYTYVFVPAVRGLTGRSLFWLSVLFGSEPSASFYLSDSVPCDSNLSYMFSVSIHWLNQRTAMQAEQSCVFRTISEPRVKICKSSLKIGCFYQLAVPRRWI